MKPVQLLNMEPDSATFDDVISERKEYCTAENNNFEEQTERLSCIQNAPNMMP